MVAAWVLVAGATAAVGVAALDIAGAGILGPASQPLSQQDVARQLAAVTSTPSSASSTSAVPLNPATPTSPMPRGLSTPEGSVVAQCDNGQVYLVSWSPAQGYRVDDYARGPGASASIKFKNATSEVVEIFTCVTGEPHVESAADDHGGRGGRGGR
jgi:hypothetical protein